MGSQSRRKHAGKGDGDGGKSDVIADAKAVERTLVKQISADDEPPVLQVVDATVSHGTVRPGHGLEVALRWDTADAGASLSGVVDHGCTLNAHGAGLFSALGAVGGLARMLLPLRARVSADGKLTLGAKRLSHATLNSTLDKIVDAGDPVFLIELRALGSLRRSRRATASSGRLLALLPTKASLLRAGLAASNAGEPTPVRYHGAMPSFARSALATAVLWLRWFLCSLLFAAGCWALWLAPQPTLAAAPVLWAPDGNHSSIVDVLPPHPKNMTTAFQLGGLRERLAAATDAGRESEVLAAAAALVGRSVSAEQLAGMLDEIRRFEGRVSVITRVTGFFTFTNTMWFFAILGIAVSVGPALWHLLEPLRDFLRRVITWALDNVVVPVARRLHHWGVFEVALFAGAWLLVVQGMRLPADYGEFVSLSGAALAVPCFAYSCGVHGPRVRSEEALSQLVQSWVAVFAIPLALVFDSDLLGYAVVVAMFGAVGFGVWARPLCLFIGFSDQLDVGKLADHPRHVQPTLPFPALLPQNAMHRCAVSASVLLTLFFAAQWFGVSPHLLRPFSSGVSVFGTVVLFIAMLIMSSRYYVPASDDGTWSSDGNPHFWRINAAMVAMLVASQLGGHVVGYDGLANVGTVFTCIYTMDKYGEFHVSRGYNAWVLMLLVSVTAWRLSLELHRHPEYIASIASNAMQMTS